MSTVSIRPATVADVGAVVALLADDDLGAARETPDDLEPYLRTFELVERDPAQLLVVADQGGEVVGTLQLSLIPGLSRRGATRALIEAVRVASSQRGNGLGRRLIQWAIEEAKRRGAVMVQLTSDASRTDAHRFYERLGFTASHVGFKLPL